jgi:hypothetical protein
MLTQKKNVNMYEREENVRRACSVSRVSRTMTVLLELLVFVVREVPSMILDVQDSANHATL